MAKNIIVNHFSGLLPLTKHLNTRTGITILFRMCVCLCVCWCVCVCLCVCVLVVSLFSMCVHVSCMNILKRVP